MKKIKADKKRLIRWKVYVDRARMYIGYIQFLMIGFVFLEAYRETTIGVLIFENLLFSIPLVALLFIGASLMIGRLDTIYGLREEELRNSSTSNPVMRELLSNMEEIKLEMKKLNAKNSSNSDTSDH